MVDCRAAGPSDLGRGAPITARDHTQHLVDLDAIQVPSDANRASDFDDLRIRVVRPHIATAAAQQNGHRNAAREIRERMDAAQEALDQLVGHQPTTPAGIEARTRGVKHAEDDKRSYSQMLDVLKRACGTLCCPGDPLHAP